MLTEGSMNIEKEKKGQKKKGITELGIKRRKDKGMAEEKSGDKDRVGQRGRGRGCHALRGGRSLFFLYRSGNE